MNIFGFVTAALSIFAPKQNVDDNFNPVVVAPTPLVKSAQEHDAYKHELAGLIPANSNRFLEDFRRLLTTPYATNLIHRLSYEQKRWMGLDGVENKRIKNLDEYLSQHHLRKNDNPERIQEIYRQVNETIASVGANQNSLGLFYARALLEFELGNYDQAIRDFKREPYGDHFLLGLAQLSSGRYDEALASFATMYFSDVYDPVNWKRYYKAIAHLIVADPQTALKELSDEMSFNPHSHISDLMGLAYAAMEKEEQANICFQRRDQDKKVATVDIISKLSEFNHNGERLSAEEIAAKRDDAKNTLKQQLSNAKVEQEGFFTKSLQLARLQRQSEEYEDAVETLQKLEKKHAYNGYLRYEMALAKMGASFCKTKLDEECSIKDMKGFEAELFYFLDTDSVELEFKDAKRCARDNEEIRDLSQQEIDKFQKLTRLWNFITRVNNHQTYTPTQDDYLPEEDSNIIAKHPRLFIALYIVAMYSYFEYVVNERPGQNNEIEGREGREGREEIEEIEIDLEQGEAPPTPATSPATSSSESEEERAERLTPRDLGGGRAS